MQIEQVAVRTRAPHPELIWKLRSALEESGYSQANVARALGGIEAPVHEHRLATVLVHRLERVDRLSTLVKLFCLGGDVSIDEATKALAPLPLEGAVDLGVVECASSWVRPWMQIGFIGDMLIAYDRYTPGREPKDTVIGIGPAARSLASPTVRTVGGCALDLCTEGRWLPVELSAPAASIPSGDRPSTVGTRPWQQPTYGFQWRGSSSWNVATAPVLFPEGSAACQGEDRGIPKTRSREQKCARAQSGETGCAPARTEPGQLR